MKKFFVAFTIFLMASLVFSNEVKVKITKVRQNEGKVIISIHGSKDSFKSHVPDKTLILEASADEIEKVINLPDGEFVFCVFQDINGDGEINSNLIGIPKEPFGFSNYNGKSAPGNFEKHKVLIQKDTEISIELFKM